MLRAVGSEDRSENFFSRRMQFSYLPARVPAVAHNILAENAVYDYDYEPRCIAVKMLIAPPTSVATADYLPLWTMRSIENRISC